MLHSAFPLRWCYASLSLLMALSACTIHDPQEPGLLVPGTVDEDETLPRVEVRDTSLHVRTFGDPDDPKVFVLEGGPGADFRYMLGLIEPVGGVSLIDRHFVVFHDYRSSGLSRRHDVEDITLEDLRADFAELVDHFTEPGEQIVVLGHSHGGLVAAQYIGSHPERVRGAVLIEPGEFSGEILRDQPALVEIDYLGEGIHDVTWARQLIGAHDHATADYWVAITRESLEQGQRGDDDDPSTRAKSWRRGAAALLAIPLGEMAEYEYDFTPALGDFERPVLFVSSDGSEDLGFEFQQRHQVGFFGEAEHVLIEGTGHAGLVEADVARTLEPIFDYLDELEVVP